MYDVVIAGAGVNGLSAAYHLASRGAEVLILDEREAGKGASDAAAGMLGAQTEKHQTKELFHFAVEGRNYFESFSTQLEEASQQSVHYRKEGAWKLAFTSEEKGDLEELMTFHRKEGEEVIAADRSDLVHAVPEAGAFHLEGAAFFPHEAQVDARRYVSALKKAALNNGAVLLEYTSVKDIKRRGENWTVVTEDRELSAGKVILSHGTGRSLGYAMPDMIPVKGECVAVKPKVQPFISTIVAPQIYMVPKKDGRIIIGATETEGDYTKTVRAGAVSWLIEEACRIIPSLREAPVQEIWAGVRPKSPDGIPFAGELEKNLYVISGHYRNGILMSGLTGKEISRSIFGENNELYFMCPKRRNTNAHSYERERLRTGSKCKDDT